MKYLAFLTCIALAINFAFDHSTSFGLFFLFILVAYVINEAYG